MPQSRPSAERSGDPPLRCILALGAPTLLTDALATAINAEPGLECSGIATSYEDALSLVSDRESHVLVLEGALSGDVIECMDHARQLTPDLSVLVLSPVRDDALMSRVASAGASGCLLMDSPFAEIVRAIRTARGGGIVVDRSILSALIEERPEDDPPVDTQRATTASSLTPRERNVLTLMGEGLEPLAIAKSLGITLNTCRGHVQNILEKLGTHSQLEAVVTAAHLGLLPGLSRRE